MVVLLDGEAVEVVALHRRLVGHCLQHAQTQREHLARVDGLYILKLAVFDAVQLLGGQQAHRGGVFHYDLVRGLASTDEVGIDEFD